MRVRHKTPTLVSMWMLDVFCCALGCVTLLWLLNTRQAGDQAVSAKSAILALEQTRADYKIALNAAERKIDATQKEVALASERVDSAADALRKKQREADALAKKLTDAT